MGQGLGDQAQRPLSPMGSCGLLIPPISVSDSIPG